MLNQKDYKILTFLDKHRKNRPLFLFCSFFSCSIGVIVILACIKVYQERFLWEGLCFISIGISLHYLNTKFIQIAELIDKLMQSHKQ